MIWRHSRPTLHSCVRSGSRLQAGGVVFNSTKTGQSIASILALSSPEPDQHQPHIKITGHVRTIRNQKRHSFVKVGDGSTTSELQALLQPAQAEGYVTRQNFAADVEIQGLTRFRV